jgi:hypothetical protein
VAAVEVAVVSTLVVEAMVDLTCGSFMDLIRGRFIPVPAFIPDPFIPVPAFILDHFNSACGGAGLLHNADWTPPGAPSPAARVSGGCPQTSASEGHCSA